MKQNIKIRDNGKILRISTENQSLSVCGYSANISTYDGNGNAIEFMNIPKEMLDTYAEMYIKKNFELSEKDGWIRRLENENV